MATPEGVYLAVGSRCLLLDAATGKTVREFALPAADGQQPRWGFIGVYENLLLAGTGFGDYSHAWDTSTRRRRSGASPGDRTSTAAWG